MQIAILGCGGIGYHLAEHVLRTISAKTDDFEVFLIDGDVIQTHNLERQFFPGVVGWDKASALADILSKKFPGQVINPVNHYFNNTNLKYHKNEWFKSGITIMMCVDNNATRAFVSEHARRLKDVTIIDGGNDDVLGQARLYMRLNGKDILPPIEDVAPEILHSKDRIPDTDHCLEEGVTDPQTALVNSYVAMAMQYLLVNVLADEDRWSVKNPPVMNEIRVNTNYVTDVNLMQAFRRESVHTL